MYFMGLCWWPMRKDTWKVHGAQAQLMLSVPTASFHWFYSLVQNQLTYLNDFYTFIQIPKTRWFLSKWMGKVNNWPYLPTKANVFGPALQLAAFCSFITSTSDCLDLMLQPTLLKLNQGINCGEKIWTLVNILLLSIKRRFEILCSSQELLYQLGL